MYLPAAFKQDSPEAQAALIRRYPLGLLITHGADGFEANPIPFLVDVVGGEITLRAHLSRGNAQWKSLAADGRCMAVFQGEEGYVSPSWYPSKKQNGGKTVPTWNYVSVQVSGEAKIIESSEWLLTLLRELTQLHEGGQREPWSVSDAPENFIAAQMKGIVGIELVARKVEGKWKLSQNRTAEDVSGVIDGLRELEGPESTLAQAMVQASSPK
ncbi:transcriptional regulator [Enterobacterales bacterium]|nr:transcriptional regulator [Enterobacterales bacterium]